MNPSITVEYTSVLRRTIALAGLRMARLSLCSQCDHYATSPRAMERKYVAKRMEDLLRHWAEVPHEHEDTLRARHRLELLEKHGPDGV